MSLKVGLVDTSAGISGGGYTADQQLDFLRQLMPNIGAGQLSNGSWMITVSPAVEKYIGPGIRQSSPFNGKTREDAINDAFRYYTEGAPQLVFGHPDTPRFFEAKWAGNGWEVQKGTLPSSHGTAAGREITHDQKVLIGSVASKEAAPTQTIVGVYHKGEKSAHPAMQFLDKGFAADGAGNWEKALKDYKTGLGVLIGVVTKDYEKELQGLGLDPIKMAIDQNPIIFQRACEELGIFDKEPEVKAALLKYYNRNGLAEKHHAESLDDPQDRKRVYGDSLFFCHLATELKPDYGPALYNQACVAWRALGDEQAALDFLEKAIADKSFDFRKLAREGDTDWNDLRLKSPRFRELVGLPALP